MEDTVRPTLTIDIPTWASHTPSDTEYRLIAFVDCSGEQDIDMSREEFITLKAHLAAMRGYSAPTVTEAIAQMKVDPWLETYSGIGGSDDQQQSARHLETARDLYHAVPHLVLLESEQFDSELRRLAE
jgi:hypothetical protein